MKLVNNRLHSCCRLTDSLCLCFFFFFTDLRGDGLRDLFDAFFGDFKLLSGGPGGELSW